MRKTFRRPKNRLLKFGGIGAGLMSISNPTHVTAAEMVFVLPPATPRARFNVDRQNWGK